MPLPWPKPVAASAECAVQGSQNYVGRSYLPIEILLGRLEATFLAFTKARITAEQRDNSNFQSSCSRQTSPGCNGSPKGVTSSFDLQAQLALPVRPPDRVRLRPGNHLL